MKRSHLCVLCWMFFVDVSIRSVDACADEHKPFRILVLDRENEWPVSMVELRTLHRMRFVTDNAGIVAMDVPELMGYETWLDVLSPGYEVAKDGFGMRGVRVTPRPGEATTIYVTRTSIAQRLGRLTGSGLLAESQKLGNSINQAHQGRVENLPGSVIVSEAPILGCDSVQTAVHQGKLFWLWGDTNLANYPLGVFHMTGATTWLPVHSIGNPPLSWSFDYFRDERGRPKAMAPMPGKGPTWLTGVVTLADEEGAEHLVALYRKIQPPLDIYELGACEWNNADQTFRHVKTLWKASDDGANKPPMQFDEGHANFWKDEHGTNWVLVGNPFPHAKFHATLEAWKDTQSWETIVTPKNLWSESGEEVKPHSGSIAWFPSRQRWVAVFMQVFGKPSAFGELWYAESSSPLGPWGTAVKILSHENYTFYNPRIHPEFSQADSSHLYFEGTYTRQFAKSPEATPRYDYNQILYQVDLDSPSLAPARSIP